MIYKVQYAYAPEVGSPNIHSQEEHARSEVAYLLDTWLMKNLDSYWRTLIYQGRGEEHTRFIEASQAVVSEVRNLLALGHVWPAYDLWHDFYDEFENELGFPLFVAIGTVLVKTRDPKGPKRTQRKLMKVGGPPPITLYKKGGTTLMAQREEHEMFAAAQDLMNTVAQKAKEAGIKITAKQYEEAVEAVENEYARQFKGQKLTQENIREFYLLVREGVLKSLFGGSLGYSLGVFKNWLVQYADFGGAWHAGRHTNEERAKYQAQDYLEILLHHLLSHASMEDEVGRNQDYVRAAYDVIKLVSGLLEEGKVWRAYLEYKIFEEEWGDKTGSFPLQMSIGTMRVIPEPEAEE